MVSSMARGGRRRRVLNEEARATASHRAIPATERSDSGDAVVQRYGQQAHIENHPQVTDFIPRRKRRVCLIVLTGVFASAAAQSLTRTADSIAVHIPGVPSTDLKALASGLVAWTSAAMLAAAAVTSILIHALRRHRVDDVRGRYRVWKWAAISAGALSVNAVVHVDRLLAAAASSAGWSFTSSGVEWRIVPAMLLGCWVALRITVDLTESRGGLFTMACGLFCYAVGVGALVGSSVGIAPWAVDLLSAAPLVGHTLVFAAILLYARYVVLDVQGLIDHEPERRAAIRAANAPAIELAEAAVGDNANQSENDDRNSDSRPATTKPVRSEDAAPDSDRWVDGSESIGSSGEDDDFASTRKLSKAQRKKLRKQKMQRRAA